jgi:hypothetical protein
MVLASVFANPPKHALILSKEREGLEFMLNSKILIQTK